MNQKFAEPPGVAIWETSARTSFGSGIEPIIEALSVGREFSSFIDGFDVRDELGSRGTRTLDRGTALALSSVDQLNLLSQLDRAGRDIGVVFTTSMGSLATTIQFTQEGLKGKRPYLVDPSKFPNTVMNFAAGQAAIRHGLQGPNATLIAGDPSGLYALLYAERLIRLNQASAIVVGGAEEWSIERERLEQNAGAAAETIEGSACLLVGPNNLFEHQPLGYLDLVVTGYAKSASQLRELIRRWQTRPGLDSLPRRLVGVGDPSGFERALDAMQAEVPGLDAIPETFHLAGEGRSLGSWGGGLAVALALDESACEGTEWVLAADPRGPIALAVVTHPVNTNIKQTPERTSHEKHV